MKRSKNGRLRLTGICIECGANKSKFVKSANKQGGYIGDALFEAGLKGLYEVGKAGANSLLEGEPV